MAKGLVIKGLKDLLYALELGLLRDMTEVKVLRIARSCGVDEKWVSILSDYYGLEGRESISMREIGRRHGCSVENISAIMPKALRRLRIAVYVSEIGYSQETSIDLVDLSLKISNRLAKAGITTIGALTKLSEPELLRVHGVNRFTLEEVKRFLAKAGLELKAIVLSGEASVKDVGFSTWAMNFFSREKIGTLGDISRFSEKELMRKFGFGKKCLSEIREVLAKAGLRLRGE